MIISKSYKSIIILSLLLKNTTHGCMKCCTKSTCESHVSIRKQECQVYYHNYLYCAETYGCRNEGIDIAQFIPCENCQGDLPENKKCKEEFDAFVKDAKASMNDLKNLKNDLAEQWIKTQSWFELLNENQKAVLADNAAKFDAINKRFDQLDEDNKRLLENQEKLQYGLKNLMQIVINQMAQQQEWYEDLSSNDKEILNNQGKILAWSLTNNEAIQEVGTRVGDLQNKIDTLDIENWYKEDIKGLIDIHDMYVNQIPIDIYGNKNSADIIFEKWHEEFFPILAMRFIKNTLVMMNGGVKGGLDSFKPSIYSKTKEVCTTNNHEEFKYLLQQVHIYLKQYSDFLPVNKTMDLLQFETDHSKNLIAADESYALNCGCKKGQRLYRTKRLSELIPSLEPTLSPIEVNIDKVGMSTFDLTTRRKARLILEKGINFEASDEQIMAINILYIKVKCHNYYRPHSHTNLGKGGNKGLKSCA